MNKDGQAKQDIEGEPVKKADGAICLKMKSSFGEKTQTVNKVER